MQELKEITSDWVQHFTKEKVYISILQFLTDLESSINFSTGRGHRQFPNWLKP